MRPQEDDDVEVDPTPADVGSEGGSPGYLEVARRRGHGVGTEATETWRPWDDDEKTIARDETGKGRRAR